VQSFPFPASFPMPFTREEKKRPPSNQNQDNHVPQTCCSEHFDNKFPNVTETDEDDQLKDVMSLQEEAICVTV